MSGAKFKTEKQDGQPLEAIQQDTVVGCWLSVVGFP